MKVLRVLPVIMAAVVLAACEIFLVQPGERLNPDDDQNPVPPPFNVDVNLNLEDPSNRFVRISWSEYDTSKYKETENYKIKYDGSLIVRQTMSAPSGVFDGRAVYQPFAGSGGSFEYDDYQFEEGYPNYYAVFSYAAKWGEDQLSQDEKLYVTEDGTIQNHENYYFTGPVVKSVTPWAYKYFPANYDAYIDSADVWIDSGTELWVSSIASTVPPAPPDRISCINFNLDGMPQDVILKGAVLMMFTSGAATEESNIDVTAFSSNWDAQTFGIISGGTITDDSTTAEMWVTNGVNESVNASVTDIFTLWYNDPSSAFGLRLMEDENILHDFRFHSVRSSNEDYRPKIRMMYMYDE